MSLIVAIPTNRPGRHLEPLLAMLSRQVGCAPFAVIVVNDSQLHWEFRHDLVESFLRFEIISAAGRGLACARNTALDAAHDNEIVVFIDDDMKIDADFVSAYSDAFANDSNLDAAGGPIVPIFPNKKPLWIFGKLHEFLGYHNRKVGHMYVHDTPFGGNFAVRKVSNLIPFDGAFGLGGLRGLLGEEVRFFQANSFRHVVYVHRAICRHSVTPAQLKVRWHLRRLWAQVRTRVALQSR